MWRACTVLCACPWCLLAQDNFELLHGQLVPEWDTGEGRKQLLACVRETVRNGLTSARALREERAELLPRIVTAASAAFFARLLNFIGSVHVHEPHRVVDVCCSHA